jgi:DNA-binding response OmpR family regulator
MKLLLVSSDAAMAGLFAKMLSEQGHELVMSDDPAATWQMARGEVALVCSTWARLRPIAGASWRGGATPPNCP